MAFCPLLSQGFETVSGLHQAEPKDLHRPGGDWQGGRGLAAGRKALLPYAGRRAGGNVLPGMEEVSGAAPFPPWLGAFPSGLCGSVGDIWGWRTWEVFS